MCYRKNSFLFNSTGEVSLSEQAGHGAAAKVLWQLGSRGMTVNDLVFCLEKLKWEQELRLLKEPGKFFDRNPERDSYLLINGMNKSRPLFVWEL